MRTSKVSIATAHSFCLCPEYESGVRIAGETYRNQLPKTPPVSAGQLQLSSDRDIKQVFWIPRVRALGE